LLLGLAKVVCNSLQDNGGQLEICTDSGLCALYNSRTLTLFVFIIMFCFLQKDKEMIVALQNQGMCTSAYLHISFFTKRYNQSL